MQFEGHKMLALLYHGVMKSRHVHNKLSDLKRKDYTEGSSIRMSPPPPSKQEREHSRKKECLKVFTHGPCLNTEVLMIVDLLVG